MTQTEHVNWEGLDAIHFEIFGRESWIIQPAVPRGDRKWVWRTEFFGAFDYADMALVRDGYYLVFHNVSDLYGCPQSILYMEKFYAYVVSEYRLNPKAVMIGLSRGGLYACNFALAHPDQVSCLYLDAPVLDIRSWPGGKYSGPGEEACWAECLNCYGLTEETAAAFRDNPLDHIKEIADAKIPVVLVCGDADELVPFSENGRIFDRKFRALGGKIKTIVKPGCGHHPHSLENPAEIVNFIERET